MAELLADARTSLKRTVTPKEAVGAPTLAGYADASTLACCVVVYVIWKLAEKEESSEDCHGEEGEEGSHLEPQQKTTTRFSSQILVARARVNPLAGTTIPKAELQALLILMRLQVEILHSTSLKPERVVSTSDSKCVLAALNKQGAQLKAFFSNRVAEAHQLLQEGQEQWQGMEQVTWVEVNLNPADIGTRPG